MCEPVREPSKRKYLITGDLNMRGAQSRFEFSKATGSCGRMEFAADWRNTARCLFHDGAGYAEKGSRPIPAGFSGRSAGAGGYVPRQTRPVAVLLKKEKFSLERSGEAFFFKRRPPAVPFVPSTLLSAPPAGDSLPHRAGRRPWPTGHRRSYPAGSTAPSAGGRAWCTKAQGTRPLNRPGGGGKAQHPEIAGGACPKIFLGEAQQDIGHQPVQPGVGVPLCLDGGQQVKARGV